MKNEKYCQSCGMPMTEKEHFGVNADGTLNSDYCCYCWENGEFTRDWTMEQMIDFCLEFEKDSGRYQNSEEARKAMLKWFPTLARWKK